MVCCVAISHVQSSAWALEEDAPLEIRGSSILRPVVETWADEFGQLPGAPRLNIVATGTSEGIGDLLSGRAEIAMASRPMSRDELATAREKGLVVRELIVARMGIAVIVNRGNPVSTISMVDLAEVFSGDTRNWQALGGSDEQIVVVRKDSGWSPEFFRLRVMKDREFFNDSVMVDSKEGVVAEVSGRPWSIGVTGMPEAISALDKVSLIRLTRQGSEEDATYALSRPLFFFTIGGSVPVQQFLDFVSGEGAQEMIVESGLYPAKQADSMASDS